MLKNPDGFGTELTQFFFAFKNVLLVSKHRKIYTILEKN